RDVEPVDVEVEIPAVERLALLDARVDAPEAGKAIDVAVLRRLVVTDARPGGAAAVEVEGPRHGPGAAERIRRHGVDDLGLIEVGGPPPGPDVVALGLRQRVRDPAEQPLAKAPARDQLDTVAAPGAAGVLDAQLIVGVED